MTTWRLLQYSAQAETRSLLPKRTHSSMRLQPIDHHGRVIRPRDEKSFNYYGTRPMIGQDLYSSTRQQTNRLLRYSKTQLKVANDKLRQKQLPDQLSTQKKKVLYIQMLKVLQWTHIHIRAKRILQQNGQASGAGSKPLITLSAMGFISTTNSENFSSEQPMATPSPIRAKFAEGRKDLTNPKA